MNRGLLFSVLILIQCEQRLGTIGSLQTDERECCFNIKQEEGVHIGPDDVVNESKQPDSNTDTV